MRMLWASNIATPYRIPMWEALNRRFELTIVLMAQTLPSRTWRSSELLGELDAVVVDAPVVKAAEDIQLFFPNRALRKVASSQFDVLVIDGWESPSYQYLMWRAKRRGKKVVCFYQSTLDSHRFHRGPVAWVRRKICANADIVVSTGNSSTQAAIADGVSPSRIHEAFNPIDTAAFRGGATTPAADQHGGHTFVFAGQLIERKNPGAVIEAYAQVRESADLLLVIGGGPLRGELERLSRELGVADVVRFCGHLNQADVAAIFQQQGDTLLMPSIREVYGLVAAEALATGMQCVVSRTAGITSAIRGMRGVYVCETDVESIAESMRCCRAAWDGRILDPEVTSMTEDSFAEIFAGALYQ